MELVNGEKGQDREDGDNRQEGGKEDRVFSIFTHTETVIEAVVYSACAKLEAVVQTRTCGVGGDVKGSPGGIRCTEEQDGSLLKFFWEVELVDEEASHKSQGPDRSGNYSSDEEGARLLPHHAGNEDGR